jgi:hypothetical protein
MDNKQEDKDMFKQVMADVAGAAMVLLIPILLMFLVTMFE